MPKHLSHRLSTGMAYALDRTGAAHQAWALLALAVAKHRSSPLGPAIAAAFATLAGPFDKAAEALEQGERSLRAIQGDGGLGTGGGEMKLRFALGCLYDKQGDFDQAFAHFAAANQLNRQIFDVADFTAHIDAMIEVFPTPEPNTIAENNDVTPVFIVGMPRSGTTLVEQILACHPQIHGAGELPYLREAIETMARDMDNPLNLPYPRLLRHAKLAALNAAAAHYLKHLRQSAAGVANIARISDKLPGNIMQVGMITRLFPRDRIIHLRRHVMDTCLSCFSQGFGERLPFTTDLDHLAAYYSGYDRISLHWADNAGIAMLDIAYEDLVGDVEATSRRLLDFTGLPWDLAVLDFYKSDRIVNTASYEQVRQPTYHSTIGRWQRYGENLRPLMDGLASRGIVVPPHK